MKKKMLISERNSIICEKQNSSCGCQRRLCGWPRFLVLVSRQIDPTTHRTVSRALVWGCGWTLHLGSHPPRALSLRAWTRTVSELHSVLFSALGWQRSCHCKTTPWGSWLKFTQVQTPRPGGEENGQTPPGPRRSPCWGPGLPSVFHSPETWFRCSSKFVEASWHPAWDRPMPGYSEAAFGSRCNVGFEV